MPEITTQTTNYVLMCMLFMQRHNLAQRAFVSQLVTLFYFVHAPRYQGYKFIKPVYIHGSFRHIDWLAIPNDAVTAGGTFIVSSAGKVRGADVIDDAGAADYAGAVTSYHRN